MGDRQYVQTFHKDEPDVVLWEGWVEKGADLANVLKRPRALNPDLYYIPTTGVELGRTWSVRWLDGPPVPSVT
jgi:hypothetical protein